MSDAEEREARLAELADQFADDVRAGRAPSITDYARRHPDLADDIRDLFPSIQGLEDLALQRLPSAGAGLPSDTLGDFEIVREVGRGGMGIVYEAVQSSLGRRVALKVLPPSAFLDETQLSRFQHEAETVSRLHHPNIAPIYQFGREQGVHFYAMHYVDGRNLQVLAREGAQLADDRAEHWRRLAQLGADAADALHYAHSCSVLHRDIKPSNLMLDVAGKVWITDFGIAKVAERDNLTHTGDFVGTLRYAPPEHFAGSYDARSDVYGLGLTLYELATGRPAHPATTQGELAQRLRGHEAIPPPRQITRDLPADLATIISVATAAAPADRYPSASAMADDLTRFVSGVPVVARPASWAERAVRACRRNPGITASLAAAILATVAAAAIGWWAYLETNDALGRESEATASARESLRGQRAATARAQANLDLSLEAFDGLFDAIAGRDTALLMRDEDGAEVPSLPAITPGELAALQQLLGFYDQFAVANEGDARLRADTATALRRVGDIHRWLGSPEDAIDAYERSLALHRQAQDAGNPLDSMEGAILHKSLGHAHADRGNVLDARGAFERAHRSLLAEVEDEHGDPIRARYELARVANALGLLVAQSKLATQRVTARAARRSARGTRESARFHRMALSTADELLDLDADNPEFRLLHARSKRLLAQILLVGGETDDANRVLVDVIATLEELTADFPSVPDYRLELIEAYTMVGEHHPNLSHASEKALAATACGAALTAEYPDVPRYAEAQSRALRVHASVLAENTVDGPGSEEHFDRATAAFRDAARLRAELWERFPYAVQHLWELVVIARAHAALERSRGNPAAAAALLSEVGDRVEAARGLPAAMTRRLLRLGDFYADLADALASQGREDEARAARRRAQAQRRAPGRRR